MAGRQQRFASWIIGGFGLFLAGTAFTVPLLRAQEGGGGGGAAQEPTPAPAPGPGADTLPRSPFTLHPADKDAIRYDETLVGPKQVNLAAAEADTLDLSTARALAAEPRQAVDDTAEWAETTHGPVVHRAWSAYSAHRVREAAVKRAEYEAGLAGIGDVGVR